MKREKILTISIAAYNVEKYIQKAIESLIEDEVIDDLEVFVIDDGGTDSTLNIAQKYADQYPASIFCVHKENGGYGSTINASLKLATGKYFQQLDGDDWFHIENLKTYINLLREVSADFVLTSSENYYEEINKRSSFNYNYIEEGLYEIEKSELNTRLSIHNVAFRTSILKKMDRPLTEHCFYTDSEFISYPIPFLDTVYISHMPIYVYRIGGREEQSSSLHGVKKHYKEMELVIKNIAGVYEAISEIQICKRTLLRNLLSARCCELFRFYCVLPLSRNVLCEMKRFQQWVETNYPEIIRDIKQKSNVLRMLLNNNFIFYLPAHIWIQSAWRKPPKDTTSASLTNVEG